MSNTAYVPNEATFRKNVLTTPGLFQNWKGALILELRSSKPRKIAVPSQARSVWSERFPEKAGCLLATAQHWTLPLPTGEVTQPNSPTIKTNIIHAGVEHDKYLNPKLYAFGSGAWDHNFSQGLDLQQTYGGGLGWTVFQTDTADLNFRASANYIRQQFTNSSFNQNLFGSTFAETYNQKFSRGIVLAEALSITPAWNSLNAYSALGSITLSLPLYKRFNLTLGTIDSFLNNPPPGFRKNSFQFITGLTYTLP